ncbi:MAG: STM4014 family protein [Pirellulales bacterium]|nr:STM4014 family protein [Pirellulales bacterium]
MNDPPVEPAAGSRCDGPQAILVIGNPENRRVAMFCAAARRLGLPAPRVVAYEDVLYGGLDVRQQVPRHGLVRIESPGENERVERALIALGAEQTPLAELPADYVPGEIVEHGRIYFPGLWYRGFCRLLDAWQEDLAKQPIAWMNHPADIKLAFDKAGCQAMLDQQGIRVPGRLGTIGSYDELRARMRETGHWRVFVKLSHGSSASGVVALEAGRNRICATTSVEIARVGGRTLLYNSLRLRRYENEREVAEVVNGLCVHGVHVEAWMPKASLGDGTFDLRVVVIAGEVRHIVVRTSRGPITNLHLGNRRGDLAELLRKIPGDRFAEAWDTCRRTATLFPRSLYLGMDLMFTPSFRRHAVLELNAFGDLLPGALHCGQDTYTAELAAARGKG